MNKTGAGNLPKTVVKFVGKKRNGPSEAYPALSCFCSLLLLSYYSVYSEDTDVGHRLDNRYCPYFGFGSIISTTQYTTSFHVCRQT